MKVVIIDYGAGNTRSVQFALQRLGVQPVLSNDHKEIIAADKVIFPGVGHAKAAMDVIREKQLDILIPQLKQPVLGICLGMQLMCRHSEEGNTPGLGIFDDNVKLFDATLKVPHIGWNTAGGSSVLASAMDEWYYFVHSFYVPQTVDTTMICNYGINFSAAIQKNNFYGVQFHPEKSGLAGEKLLKKFLTL